MVPKTHDHKTELYVGAINYQQWRPLSKFGTSSDTVSALRAVGLFHFVSTFSSPSHFLPVFMLHIHLIDQRPFFFLLKTRRDDFPPVRILVLGEHFCFHVETPLVS